MKAETRPIITAEELAVLKVLVDSGKLTSKCAIRLRVILHRAAGTTLESISASLSVSLSSVIRYVKRFNAGGLESLLEDKTRKPGKTPVSVETKNTLCAIVRGERPDAARWSVRSLAKRVGVSKSAVHNILRERGIQSHPAEPFRFSNESFEEKPADVVGLYMRAPDNVIVLCADGKSRIPAPGEHIPARQAADYERRGTAALFAALNVLTGEAAGACRERHNAEDYIEFLKTVDQKCGAGKALHIIADNYSTHRTKEAQAYFAGAPGRFKTHCLPAHSSWLHTVERRLGEITNKRIRPESRGSQELAAAMREYITHWNRDSGPFTWTKSAAEIMGSIQS
ncbi:MAG: IS630 family transposase [Treponema sp.]|nr:IS630 family transposase [Treponema sp.]